MRTSEKICNESSKKGSKLHTKFAFVTLGLTVVMMIFIVVRYHFS